MSLMTLLGRTTVLGAKGKLKIRHTRILTPSGWTGYWLLPGQEVPREERLPSPPNLEPRLKRLRERYGRGGMIHESRSAAA